MMKCLSKLKCKTFRHGTSLLEVLVASGVIATGVAVILPSVGNIRESSQSLTCKDHLRTLGQAQLSYSLDNMNRFAGDFTLESQPSWALNSWIQILNHEYFGDEFVGGSNSSYSFIRANSGTIRWVVLSNTHEQIKDQIWCPSLRNVRVNSLRCYPMNRDAGNPRWENQLRLINSTDGHPKYKTYELGEIITKYKNPAISVLHHEALISNDWVSAGNDQPLYLIDSYQNQFPGAANTTGVPYAGSSEIPWHFRHNYRMNILHMDGHVATEALVAEGLNAAERYHYDD